MSGVSSTGGLYVYDPASKRVVSTNEYQYRYGTGHGEAATHGAYNGAYNTGTHGAAYGHERRGLVKSFLSGIPGSLKDMAKGLFLDENGHVSPGKIATAVGMGALLYFVPFVGIPLGVYFAGKSAIKTVDNVIDVATAYSRGDYYAADEAAYRLGSSATETALSMWGTAAAVKATRVANATKLLAGATASGDAAKISAAQTALDSIKMPSIGPIKAFTKDGVFPQALTELRPGAAGPGNWTNLKNTATTNFEAIKDIYNLRRLNGAKVAATEAGKSANDIITSALKPGATPFNPKAPEVIELLNKFRRIKTDGLDSAYQTFVKDSIKTLENPTTLNDITKIANMSKYYQPLIKPLKAGELNAGNAWSYVKDKGVPALKDYKELPRQVPLAISSKNEMPLMPSPYHGGGGEYSYAPGHQPVERWL